MYITLRGKVGKLLHVRAVSVHRVNLGRAIIIVGCKHNLAGNLWWIIILATQQATGGKYQKKIKIAGSRIFLFLSVQFFIFLLVHTQPLLLKPATG